MENKDNNVVWEYETTPAPDAELIKNESTTDATPDETTDNTENSDITEDSNETADEADESSSNDADEGKSDSCNETDEPTVNEASYEDHPDEEEYQAPETTYEESMPTEAAEVEDINDIVVDTPSYNEDAEISVAPIEELPKPTKKDRRKQMKEMSDSSIRSKRIIDRIFLVLTILLFAVPVGLLIYIILTYFL